MHNKRQGSNKVSHKADTQKCKEMFINHFETITINIIIAFFIIYSLITEHLKKKSLKVGASAKQLGLYIPDCNYFPLFFFKDAICL